MYRGAFSNSDYGVSARIPDGLEGWGSDANAPFHGFAVFLTQRDDEARASCIALYLGLDVVLPEDAPHVPRPGFVPVRIGNRNGIEYASTGVIGGVPLLNVTVFAEFSRRGEANVLRVSLVTPTADRRKTEPLFRAFLASLKVQ
jgi:hypothetical protein